MSRMLTRAVRLLKFGAVAGAAVGVGRLIVRRRRRAETDEASWPTIAETAAQNGSNGSGEAAEAAGAGGQDGTGEAQETSGAGDEDGTGADDADDDSDK